MRYGQKHKNTWMENQSSCNGVCASLWGQKSHYDSCSFLKLVILLFAEENEGKTDNTIEATNKLCLNNH